MKYRVSVPYLVWASIEIDADDEDAAIDAAIGETSLRGQVGNGGRGDKLIGTSNQRVSIEVCDEYFELDAIKPEAKKIAGKRGVCSS